MIDGNITTTRSERNSSDNAVILLMPQSESRRVHVFKLGRYVILHVGFIRQVSLNVRIKIIIIIKKTIKIILASCIVSLGRLRIDPTKNKEENN